MKILARNKEEKRIIDKIFSINQEQVFYFWDQLSGDKKNFLIEELKNPEIKNINKFYKKFLKKKKNKKKMEAAEYLSIKDRSNHSDMRRIGQKALSENLVAFLTVAGGQGTRFGYDYPKGFFPVTPIKKKSFFQVFAEKIKYYSEIYENEFYWYIMTSDFNYEETKKFFEMKNFFGLNKNKIIFFKQGLFPTLDKEGRLILCEKHKLLKNPDGHGGILKALMKNGLLCEMKKKGIKYISYFQVDNPLVSLADPLFIGYHIKKKSQVTSKVILKLYPEEHLGIMCMINNKNSVIEYSDLTEEEMNERNSDGKLKYPMGSIGIHIFDVNFLIQFTKRMPIHFAEKEVNGYYFSSGQEPVYKEIDAIKLETFVFDSIPVAKKSAFFETERGQEFSPLKNKTGKDSFDTCREGQNMMFHSWLADANLLGENYNGENIEISPLYAPDLEIFLKKSKKDFEKIKNKIFNENGSLKNEIYIE